MSSLLCVLVEPQNNHLSGLKKQYLRLNFRCMSDLMSVRKQLLYRILSRQRGGGVAGSLNDTRAAYQSALEDSSGLGLGTVHGLDGIASESHSSSSRGGSEHTRQKNKRPMVMAHIVVIHILVKEGIYFYCFVM